ncbi:MAG: type I methionyl aminopeptidase [bacterium]|nr:type I methionyl aminopeptidase [bacterium]
MIILKSPEEIKLMREAGRATAELCALLKEKIKPGITTLSLDDIAVSFIKKRKAIAAFLGYRGYPKSICVSINEEVVHGIPGGRVLQEGDIVSIDAGVVFGGFIGDMAFSAGVGKITAEAQKLLSVTEQSLYQGIAQARPSNHLGDISHAVQEYAESNGFSIVEQYVGHGIGRQMHEDPQVPNYGPAGCGPMLKEGMTLAIEPMVNAGTYEVEVLDDDWTVVTKDRKLSAHFEHTIAITANGPEILTKI